MKIAVLAAMAAICMFGQDAKVVAPPNASAPPTERLFTKEEALTFENSILRISVEGTKFKIEEYTKAIAPAQKAQSDLITTMCGAIGVPPEKMATNCGVQGFNQDGGPVTGPDGSVVPRKVFYVPSAPVSTSATPDLKQPTPVAKK